MPEICLFKGIRKGKWSERDLRARLLAQMNHFVAVVQKEYAKTTRTWKKKPKFEALESFKPDGPAVLVGTDDAIYKYVDEGTKRHVIMAGAFTGKSNKNMLAWPSKFRAKTRPGYIGSSQGMKKPPIAHARIVLHPGTEARNFTKTIQKENEKKFKEAMQKVLSEFAREDASAS